MSRRSQDVASEARRTVVEAAIRAKTCHIGSALSIVDILAVLYTEVAAACDPEPRVLLSKGHAASALYATLAAVGVLDREGVVSGYCADGGRLHGHPERGVPGVEMTGGSLGHGPAIAVGLALAEGPYGRPTYCLVGDGELNEGSVWESLALAGHLSLGRVTIIVDANGLQGLGACGDIVDLDPLADKLTAFGFAVVDCDGHDHDALAAALTGSFSGGPRAVIARTTKAYGISAWEGEVMSHYKTLREEDRAGVLAELEALNHA